MIQDATKFPMTPLLRFHCHSVTVFHSGVYYALTSCERHKTLTVDLALIMLLNHHTTHTTAVLQPFFRGHPG